MKADPTGLRFSGSDLFHQQRKDGSLAKLVRYYCDAERTKRILENYHVGDVADAGEWIQHWREVDRRKGKFPTELALGRDKCAIDGAGEMPK